MRQITDLGPLQDVKILVLQPIIWYETMISDMNYPCMVAYSPGDQILIVTENFVFYINILCDISTRHYDIRKLLVRDLLGHQQVQ